MVLHCRYREVQSTCLSGARLLASAKRSDTGQTTLLDLMLLCSYLTPAAPSLLCPIHAYATQP